ncbi:3-hydroxyacyl-CoA dehydrogenase family protein [Mesorhizobium sp. M7A.F.Ca.US.011.01.1.1]|uniref:3-hydroxyacyl-CoA dehydrogenase family protein n=1 Tax=Mesorhizobium sp. M7A.F.Ca.US.011.01.1.1 TaxID=2496741 RepID=UPI000FCAA81D|nr:3-hydroxyacyl-CoA dehydrogenase family protein [Mesorhizobium sp. M7A.F.Ca.US.011.01.1.1]RUX23733.1 3-hydroxyacyl-CoA dehydrogenase family protein [Mesorhizobium sp. M7A.F.Ca.US.011.01.1.1]
MPNRSRIAAVIGNGIIGHGIAEILAKAGWMVKLIGRNAASLDGARENIILSLTEFVNAGLLTSEAMGGALSRLSLSTQIADAVRAELIFEAVPEDMELKRSIFAELDQICDPEAILASSSGHPVSALDTRVTRKERVVAAHFWYPPQLMPLVEVCGSPSTHPVVIERVCRALKAAGKEPVVIDHELPGFVGNRIQFAALREAWSLWAAGYATAEAIDAIVRNSIGRRLAVTGPIESADIGGLDTMFHFASFLQPYLDVSKEPPERIKMLVTAGHRGASNGKGVREWGEGEAQDLMFKRRRELVRWLKDDQSDSAREDDGRRADHSSVT